MFEKATRQKIRFDSPQGQLSTEDLWDLPLSSRTNRANLDDIARGLNRQLKNEDDDVSFVNKEKRSTNDTVRLKFDIVKHIIDVRLVENEAAAKAQENKKEKQALLELIAQKQLEAKRSLSIEELQAMAAAL